MTDHEKQNQTWAEECEYLAQLLESGGNRDVPTRSIPGYFAVQAASSRKDHFYALAATLDDLNLADVPTSVTALRAHAAVLRPRFRVEVVADRSGEWVGNQLTFGTREEAEAYAQDLASRWTAVREWRVVGVDHAATK